MLSVLLSVYSKEIPSFLHSALLSVFNQTISADEVVLVEDGPLTEELYGVIDFFRERYHEQLRIVKIPNNKGLGYALNEGLKYCSNELVARMDTDDIAKPERFSNQLSVFLMNPDVDVVGSWVDEFDSDIHHISSKRKLPQFHKEIFSFAKRRNPINHPVVMFKKSAVIAAGGYIHLHFFEDYYLWVRMLMNGSIFYNIQDSLLYFRFSSDVFKRRGGWKYALDELRFQNAIRNLSFIDNLEFVENISIRLISRIIPNKIRTILYKRILRK